MCKSEPCLRITKNYTITGHCHYSDNVEVEFCHIFYRGDIERRVQSISDFFVKHVLFLIPTSQTFLPLNSPL
jgi:hypothetical protein